MMDALVVRAKMQTNCPICGILLVKEGNCPVCDYIGEYDDELDRRYSTGDLGDSIGSVRDSSGKLQHHN